MSQNDGKNNHNNKNNGKTNNRPKKDVKGMPRSDKKNTSSNASKTPPKKATVKKKKEATITLINKEVMRNRHQMEQEYKERVEPITMPQDPEVVTNNNMPENGNNVEVEIATVIVATPQEDNISIEAVATAVVQEANQEPSSTALSEASAETAPMVTPSDEENKKRAKRPSTIELKDKSETFKSIIDIALAYEKLEEERKKLRLRVKAQSDEINDLMEEKESLKGNLAAMELLCQKKQADIEGLQAEVKHFNEVIAIQKADKDKSAQEYKNALGAALHMYIQDFKELLNEEMDGEVVSSIIDTFESVINVLAKNGISI